MAPPARKFILSHEGISSKVLIAFVFLTDAPAPQVQLNWALWSFVVIFLHHFALKTEISKY